MAVNEISAQLFSKMFLAGAKNLENQKDYINELNVFPVPDGDTGTNMTLTIMSAVKELNNVTDVSMTSVCKAISSGSLRGARGNSGVILSQLLRGFTKTVSDKSEITIPIIADGCEAAVKTAYKAVMKPKEGTILTVAAGIATKARELSDAGYDNMEKFLKEVCDYGDEVLNKTPDMLPVLKQAGVVDSGGKGLMEVIRGGLDLFLGKEVDLSFNHSSKASTKASEETAVPDIKYGYATDFVIIITKGFNIKQELDFKAYLDSIGDSITVETNDEVVKVHFNTNDPGLAIQRALKFGMLANLKIENLKLDKKDIEKIEQSSKKDEADKVEENVKNETKDKKKYGFIAVSIGKGVNDIFTSLGVDYVIAGGQTMNPSTEDVLTAIENVNADYVFVLPNNKNIVMAANQARDLTTDKEVIVIPTKTVPQGIAALINFMEEATPEENEAGMIEGASNIKTGQVTYAVRDTEIDDKIIHQGDFMGIGDSGILAVGKDMEAIIIEMLEAMVDEDAGLITLYYGEDVTEDKATKVNDMIAEKFADLDVELQYGGQPVYYYMVSVE